VPYVANFNPFANREPRKMGEDATAIDAAEKPRTLARRRQVLEAASHCFRRHGFHSCSMSQIAIEAGMSVGHIYRYFKGKEAIIAAIVREDVDEILCKIADFPTTTPDLRAALTERAEEGVMRASEPDQAALMIEIRAEAARSQEIGDLVRETDQKISDQLREIIAKAVGRKLDKADLDARVEMFQLIFQGIGLRTAINPAINRKALSQIVKLTIDAILT
jgi:TetR/AcrR family transcriptional repressor of uid operon